MTTISKNGGPGKRGRAIQRVRKSVEKLRGQRRRESAVQPTKE